MSWKRIIYVLFLLLVAGFTGLVGAAAGGLAVYNAIHQQANPAPISQPLSTSFINTPIPNQPASNNPSQVIQLPSVNIETDITKAVEKVGPAVVTIISTLPGQFTPFGLTSDQ